MTVTLKNGTLINGTLQVFTPLALNPDLWLNHRDITTITKDGAEKVSEQDDKSVSLKNALQGDPALQPIYTPGIIGGQAAFDYDGVNDKMATALNWSIQFHIFIVIRPQVVTGVRTILSSYDGSGGLSSQGEYVLDLRSGSNFLFQAFNTSPPLSGAPSGGVNPNTNYLVELTSDAGKNLEMIVNNELLDTGTHGTSGATKPIYISGYTAGTANTFNGYSGEIVKFPFKLSAGDRAKMLSYYAGAYGV